MGQINQPSNIVDKIADLERQIKELRARVGLSSATISSGSLTVKDGASFKVLHPSGYYMLVMERSAATGQFSFIIARDDGSAVFAELLNPDTGLQFWGLFDHNTYGLVTEDPSGVGLGRPYLDIPLYRGRTADWTTTTSGSFEDLYTAGFDAQHPRLGWNLMMTDTGATGEARILVDGSPVGSTFSYTTPAVWIDSVAHGASLHVTHQVTVQARRTGGAGALYLSPYYMRGHSS